VGFFIFIIDYDVVPSLYDLGITNSHFSMFIGLTSMKPSAHIRQTVLMETSAFNSPVSWAAVVLCFLDTNWVIPFRQLQLLLASTVTSKYCWFNLKKMK